MSGLFASFSQNFTGSYMATVELNPSGLLVNTCYWAMFNGGEKKVFLHSIRVKMGFSGTAAASRSKYKLCRFSAIPATGGNIVDIIKKNNAEINSSITDLRQAQAGLTTTGIVFESNFAAFCNTNQLNNDAASLLSFGESAQDRFILNKNEGIAILSDSAIVQGSWAIGEIHWDEA